MFMSNSQKAASLISASGFVETRVPHLSIRHQFPFILAVTDTSKNKRLTSFQLMFKFKIRSMTDQTDYMEDIPINFGLGNFAFVYSPWVVFQLLMFGRH